MSLLKELLNEEEQLNEIFGGRSPKKRAKLTDSDRDRLVSMLDEIEALASSAGRDAREGDAAGFMHDLDLLEKHLEGVRSFLTRRLK
jgi:hypothetical protein